MDTALFLQSCIVVLVGVEREKRAFEFLTKLSDQVSVLSLVMVHVYLGIPALCVRWRWSRHATPTSKNRRHMPTSVIITVFWQ